VLDCPVAGIDVAADLVQAFGDRPRIGNAARHKRGVKRLFAAYVLHCMATN
jgi:hypothetical protein